MKEKHKVWAVAIVFILVVCGIVYWRYRHPVYEYQKDGVLTADSGIVVTTDTPIPKDIAENSRKWAEALRAQDALYTKKFLSHDVRYSTTVRDGETILDFQGTGVTADQENVGIQDTVTLPFVLYGAQ